MDASAVEAEFETRRLAFLASQGFQGRGSRVAGRLGDTYVVTGGAGASRRLLIHGGLSEGSEWSLLAGQLDGRIAIADRPGCGLSYCAVRKLVSTCAKSIGARLRVVWHTRPYRSLATET